jgi:hypothetical protein
LKPGMIERVGRHGKPPFLKWLWQTDFSGDSMPINYSFVKTVGSLVSLQIV